MQRYNFYKKRVFAGVHFKLAPVGEATNRGGAPLAVAPPPTQSQAMRHFEMHPFTGVLTGGIYGFRKA